LLLQFNSSEKVFWLGAVFDIMFEISAARDAEYRQNAQIETLKPSKMNRLQRSLVRARVPAVAKDSTVNISHFLRRTLGALETYLQNHTNTDSDWKTKSKALNSILRYWWDTFTLTTSTHFEEATFQAHLTIGTEMLYQLSLEFQTEDREMQIISTFQTSLNNDFSSSFKLTTGLSMETLWKYLRPTVISRREVLDTLLHLEQLAARFDALKWKISISVAELGNIMTSLYKAYQIVLTSDVDGPSLVQTLATEMKKLEMSIGIEEEGVNPFFATQFEALRQFKTLELMTSGRGNEHTVDIDTAVLAGQPTALGMHLSTSTQTSHLLQTVNYLWGVGNGFHPVSNSFSSSMLARLYQIGEVDLKSLELLETELPIMGQKITMSAATLCKDQVLLLNDVLLELIIKVVSLHGEDIGSSFRHWCQEISNTDPKSIDDDVNMSAIDFLGITIPRERIPPQLYDVLTVNFGPAFDSLVMAKVRPVTIVGSAAMAWSAFAIGCIKLYVPDRSFDPDKRQRLERERQSQVRLDLHKKLDALRQFEFLFSGQESNLRCQLLEEEILELGEPPEVLQEIYRPELSEMDQLQGEFRNVLKTVLGSDIITMLTDHFDNGNSHFEDSLQQIRLVESNVAQIIRRLSERFREYNDLMTPVISMLRCLQIGLYMATQVVNLQDSGIRKDRFHASKMAPFMSGGPRSTKGETLETQPIECLEFIATTAAVEYLSSFDSDLRHLLLKTIHDLYDQWAKKLESDRVEAESKSGLYRFRGSAEDEDEDDQKEFNELFPSYEEVSDKVSGLVTSNSVREKALELAKIHANIFLGNSAPLESIHSLIRHDCKQIGRLHDAKPATEQQPPGWTFLPGTLLMLNDQIEALSPSSVVPESYNFYTDANLIEARKLVSLVHQIQARFRELQDVDEIGHMQPLADVLTSCNELLQFRHTEPLAKIITKVEKVHGFMHEWQFGGWASRANSVLPLYDNITSTVVNWRRLELSTWAKLFDMETKTCDDDARSWWFVAYEVVVAAPLQTSGSMDALRSYAQKLLKDLEDYFSTAIMGQFVQRLQLLKQLQSHLRLVVIDVPAMSIILASLTNFISLYSRYEKPVQESLKKGRESLEKAMRDVLLLASWKDTNIVALRDSAKRSHHKLFKIVRKFRALLGQSMESILKQGLPDETISEVQRSYDPPLHFPALDQSALGLCASLVPDWSRKSKRFINVSKTVSMMADAAQIPASAIEGSTYLNSFLANIITSTAELQKATPSILTEDNKDNVKHLKSRKRKLFADTLKDLRQMGIKYNLGADALAKQDSLSLVLANTGVLGNVGIHIIDYYFHKAIDLAPRAREAARQHSEDLSGAEIARSSGFLEGLLQVLMAQNNSLSSAVTRMEKLEATIKLAESVWAPNEYEIKNSKTTSNHGKLLRWLPNILVVGMDLIKIHSKLSKVDAHYVLGVVSKYQNQFSNFARQFDALAKLPIEIISTERQCLEETINFATQRLNVELQQMADSRPDLAFVLNQIAPWAKIVSTPAFLDNNQLPILIKNSP
jgi:midasin (ATPase involved in ribosome maturation)